MSDHAPYPICDVPWRPEQRRLVHGVDENGEPCRFFVLRSDLLAILNHAVEESP